MFSLFYQCLKARNNLTSLRLRTFFNKSVFGMDNFEKYRKMYQRDGQFKIYKALIGEEVEGKSNFVVSSKDIRSLIYLCEDFEEDYPFLIKVSKMYHKDERIQYDHFPFGPELMKLLNFHDKFDLALEIWNDKELTGAFDHTRCYLALMNLLYKSNNYGEIPLLMDEFLKKFNSKFETSCFTITAATCYNINTPESLEKVIEYVKILKSRKSKLYIRPSSFIIALALKQERPHLALEFIEATHYEKSTCILQNLKVLALAEIGQHIEAILHLEDIFHLGTKMSAKSFDRQIFKETEEIVKKNINKSELNLLDRLNNVIEQFKSRGRIFEGTMSEKLCQSMANPIKDPNVDKKNIGYQRKKHENSFNIPF